MGQGEPIMDQYEQIMDQSVPLGGGLNRGSSSERTINCQLRNSQLRVLKIRAWSKTVVNYEILNC